jgi:hypothetical protein
VLDRLADAGRTLLLLAGAAVGIGALAHFLGWLVVRSRTAHLVWRAWSVLGVGLLLAGLAAIGYGWGVLGLQTGAGSALVGLGLLLASAGLWMIVPV